MIFTFIMSYISLKISEKSRIRKWKLAKNPEIEKLLLDAGAIPISKDKEQ